MILKFLGQRATIIQGGTSIPESRVVSASNSSSVSWNHFANLKYVIWIFAPIQQEAKHDQEKAEQK